MRIGRWKDAESTDRYRHTAASEEARRADLMPVKKPKSQRSKAS
jgi:hypothetical protein